MTATIETVPAVVMTTADGESREAQTWPDGSYACGFCQTPVFSPEGWELHEAGNAECYAKQGETYTAEPYADYHRRHYEARECANPYCMANMPSEALERVREDQRREQKRKDRDAAEKAREKAKLDAQAAREARAAELHGAVRFTGEQLGFAWCCTHTEPAESYGAEPVMCEASGWDRDEFTAHMKAHGAKQLHPSCKPVRLRKKAPAASLPKLEVNVFKWARWTQEIRVHDEMGAFDHTESAERRGQYLANGDAPHSVWVIPFEAAPWESGSAAPVRLYVGKAGRYFTDAYSAKYDRK